MKSAEQWAEEWIGPDFNAESSLVRLFKQIQSDARTSALESAAKAVQEHSLLFYWQADCDKVKNAILAINAKSEMHQTPQG